ncbi:GNAT family N-acetyltransferase [Actinoplanes awajinensis]|uniref:GNAT family N-acetyltransferase n=1 Tax=Actinoplanes awajinensis TaxID=135946 RepID=UPI000A6B7667|nr:GNAT family N-acetyltransferase [Actinoplanes awajinensis]
MTTISTGQGDPELQQLLSDELDRLNRAAITSDDETPLSIRATDATGTLIGGLTGYTWGGCGAISSLWLAGEYRGHGLGAELLAAAEAEIRRRGCDRVILSTMSFQAPGFYLRHGYQETWPPTRHTGRHHQALLLPAPKPAHLTNTPTRIAARHKIGEHADPVDVDRRFPCPRRPAGPEGRLKAADPTPRTSRALPAGPDGRYAPGVRASRASRALPAGRGGRYAPGIRASKASWGIPAGPGGRSALG